MITVLSLALVLALGVIVFLLFKRSHRAAPLQPAENPERNDKASLTGTGAMSAFGIPQPEETTVQGWQPDALVVLDKDLKLMWANSTAEKWFEFSLVDSFGQSLSMVSENSQLSDYLTRGEFDHVLDCSPPSMPESIARVCIIRFAEGTFLLQARDVSRIKILENVKRDFFEAVARSVLKYIPLIIMSEFLLRGMETTTTEPRKHKFDSMQRLT